MDDFLNNTLEEVKMPKKLALGYPVNREHSFTVTKSGLDFENNNVFINNVGSPFSPKLYSIDDIRGLEQYVINSIARHLGCHDDSMFGYVTSGGTEGNFASIWWHREYLFKQTGIEPIIIASSKSHYSLDKIANQLRLDVIKLNYDTIIQQLNEILESSNRPIIFWANIGTTVDGSIDDIQLIHALLEKYVPERYKIHADAAIYGFVIPYLAQFSSIENVFHFVDSISISGHKFLEPV